MDLLQYIKKEGEVSNENQILSGKVIYVVSTGCSKSVEVPPFIKKLESKGAKVYLFATEECQKL